MKDQTIFEALEKLGAAFPWEEVQIWIKRSPEGVICFTSHVDGNEKLGFRFEFESSIVSVTEAVDQMIERHAKDHQDAERARKAKIMELELELAKLKQTGPLTLPPFRPCLLLGVSNPRTEEPATEKPVHRPEFINVESTREP